MKILGLLVASIALAMQQNPTKDICEVEWSLVKYSDPLSGSIIAISQVDCSRRFVIKFERKNKFVTTVDEAFQFVGKYERRGNKEVRIFARIHEKLFLPGEKCNSTPTLFDMKVMLMSAFKYDVKGDTLSLYYLRKDDSEAIMTFAYHLHK